MLTVYIVLWMSDFLMQQIYEGGPYMNCQLIKSIVYYKMPSDACRKDAFMPCLDDTGFDLV